MCPGHAELGRDTEDFAAGRRQRPVLCLFRGGGDRTDGLTFVAYLDHTEKMAWLDVSKAR